MKEQFETNLKIINFNDSLVKPPLKIKLLDKIITKGKTNEIIKISILLKKQKEVSAMLQILREVRWKIFLKLKIMFFSRGCIKFPITNGL